MSSKEVIAMLKRNDRRFVKNKGGSHIKLIKGKFSYHIPFHSSKTLGKGLLNKRKSEIIEIERKIK